MGGHIISYGMYYAYGMRKLYFLILTSLTVLALIGTLWVITGSHYVFSPDAVCGGANYDIPGTPQCALMGLGRYTYSGPLSTALGVVFALALTGSVTLAVSLWLPRLWSRPLFRYGLVPLALIGIGIGIVVSTYSIVSQNVYGWSLGDVGSWQSDWTLLMKIILFLPAGILLLSGIIREARRHRFADMIVSAIFLAVIVFLSWVILALPTP